MRPFAGGSDAIAQARRAPHSIWLVSLAVALAFPLTATALGLGKAVGEPSLGETLQLEVPLTGSIESAVDNNCVAIRRPADPVDPDYFPRDMVARVERDGAAWRIVLSTRGAIRQPLIEFGIAVTCGYNISRDYLLTVSPRATLATSAASSAPPLRPPPAPAAMGGSAPATPAVPASASTPDGVPGQSITVEQDTTLEQLARRHFPGPLRQERFMRWVAEANPHLFGGATDLRRQTIAAGTRLLIPVGVPPRRPGDHQPGHPVLDSSAPKVRPSAEAVAKPVAGKRAGKAGDDRLVVGAAGGGARDYKETVALVQRLTGLMEQQVAAQTANDEKIRQLEAEVTGLRESLALSETNAKQRETQLRAQLQATTQAEQEAAQRSWWQMLLAAILGSTLAAGAIFIYSRLTTRSGEPTPREASEPAPATAPSPAAATGMGESILNSSPAASMPQAVEPSPAALRDPLDFRPPDFLADQSQPNAAAAPAPDRETADAATAAIELANIMTSMGLTESAAQTLVDHIRENPRQSLQHWLKLLELHRLSGKRDEFERSSEELRQHFNVQPEAWEGALPAGRKSLENFPHIRQHVVRLWGKPACVKYLHSLLMDNRDGTRSGFPLAVAEEILLLIAIQSDA